MTNRERMKLKRLKSKGERFENEFVLEREGERERERVLCITPMRERVHQRQSKRGCVCR